MGLIGRSCLNTQTSKSIFSWMLVTSVFVSLAAEKAKADSVSYGIRHQYQSTRALGMGDAFTAITDDYSAIFYNPAALARREDGEVNMALDLGITSAIFKFGTDVSNAQNTPGTTSQKQTAVLNVLKDQYGKTFGGRGGISGIWARPKWSFAFIPADISLELTPHQQVGPSVATTAVIDTTVAYAYASDYKGFDIGRLSWGITGKFINREYFSKNINFIELAADPNFVKSSDLTEGYSIDADLGLLYTPEVPDDGWFSAFKLARPTFSAVVRNILESGFNNSLNLMKTKSTGKPEKEYRVIDIGSKWEYPSFWIFSGRGTLDIRDMLHPNSNVMKTVHLGLEFDWHMSSWWRGSYRFGVNQGYFTAGASALFTVFNLDLVTYGQEVGSFNSPIENRIYALKASMNF